ncbi:MAG TPA: hypothetical protein VFI20_04170 [Terracidiphilus sp.]|nr:hypothetical protein [Terracidiphilus sp.]
MTPQSAPRLRSGTVLGFPLEGFGLFTSILLSLATGAFSFFASTALAIFALLAWNILGDHSINYADTYLYVGLPVGILALAVAFPYFGTLWLRAHLHR